MARRIDPADDIFAILVREHRDLSAMLGQVEAAWEAGDRSRLAERFCVLAENLYAHSKAEERVVYPALVAEDEELTQVIERARGEHDQVEAKLEELGEATPEEPGWKLLLGELRALIEAHVAEEEGEVFDLASEVLGSDDARRLAREYTKARRALFDDDDPIGLAACDDREDRLAMP